MFCVFLLSGQFINVKCPECVKVVKLNVSVLKLVVVDYVSETRLQVDKTLTL